MIKEMSLADLDKVVELEKELFKEDAWKIAEYKSEFDNPLAKLFVYKENDEIISYGGIWCLYENADITTIGVNSKYQGQGYGQMMLKHMLSYAKEHNVENVHLEVRVSNIKAINLYKKNGFEIVRIRKSYYEDNNEDAYDMMKGLL
ncbi:MAG: ribosomal protein S18-alanine N-acetyltransferase [Erysipelotrichaceae bacterium]|nr:ribosomal protein S18-alanine N-acetyltransferase [Erysipelotrichaceae bacterium]